MDWLETNLTLLSRYIQLTCLNQLHNDPDISGHSQQRSKGNKKH